MNQALQCPFAARDIVMFLTTFAQVAAYRWAPDAVARFLMGAFLIGGGVHRRLSLSDQDGC